MPSLKIAQIQREKQSASLVHFCSSLALYFLLTCMSLSFQSAIAQEDHSNGSDFKGEMAVETSYDDNLYLTKNKKEDTYLTRVLPSLSLNRASTKSFLELQYKADLYLYDGQYEGENKYFQTGKGEMQFKPTCKSTLVFLGEDTYSYAPKDVRKNLLEKNNNTLAYNDFLASCSFQQELGERFSTDLSYLHTRRNYKEQGTEYDSGKDPNDSEENINDKDSGSHKWKLNCDYKLRQNLVLKTGYTYTLSYIKDSTSSWDEQAVKGGFLWEIKPRAKLNAGFGYARMERSLDQELNEKNKNNKNKNNYLTVDSSLDIYGGQATNINISYNKLLSYISIYDVEPETYISNKFALKGQHDLFRHRVKLTCEGLYSKDDYLSSRQEDITKTVTAKIDWTFSKFLLTLEGNYQKDTYEYVAESDKASISSEKEIRKDLTRSEGLGLDWKITRSMSLSFFGKYSLIYYDTLFEGGNNDGNKEFREDELFEATVKFQLAMGKRTSFELRYQHEERKSEDRETKELLLKHEYIDGHEYIDNQYGVSIKFYF